MLVHPRLLKSARIALDISQDELSSSAGVSRRSLVKLESCAQETTFKTIQAVQRALEAYGVLFLGEDGSIGSGFRLPPGYLKLNEDGA